MATYLVSACLLGVACRYDGGSKPSLSVAALVEGWRARGDACVTVCPEELGGLGTPRPAAELRGGDGHAVLAGQATVVRCGDGADLTDAFVAGAKRSAELGQGAVAAILKARSPSCGCGQTSISGEFRPGDGVFAALLRQRGVQVRTDEDPELATLGINAGPIG